MNELLNVNEKIPQLFPGKTISIHGRFEIYPSIDELPRFFTEEGAVISNEITPKTDILVLGKASARARKLAEKLNDSGASIRIVDDLRQLWKIKLVDAVKHLLNPLTRQRFLKLHSYYWLHTGSTLPISNQKLQNFDIHYPRENSTLPLFGRSCDFEHCSLVGVDFSLFRKDQREYFSTELKFVHVCLKRSVFKNLEKGQFQDVQCEGVNLEHLKECDFTRVAVQGRDFSLDGGSLTDAHFVLSWFRVTSVIIRKLALNSPRLIVLESVNARDVSLSKLRGDVRLYSSLLESVTFEECNIEVIYMSKCDCRSIHFKNSKIGLFRATSQSPLVSCSADGCVIEIAKCDKGILESISGIQIDCYVPHLMECPSYCKLVDIATEADRIKAQVEVEDRFRNVFLLEFDFVNSQRSWRVWVNTENLETSQPHFDYWPRPSERQYDQEEYLVELFRLLYRLRFERPITNTIRTQSTRCSLPSSELKSFILDSLTELRNFLPRD